MLTKWITAAAIVLGAASALAEDAAVDATFKDPVEAESYAIGAHTARTLKRDHVDINVDMLIRGFQDGLSGGKLLMSEKELRGVMTRVQTDVHKGMVSNRRAMGLRNLEDGRKYAVEYAKNAGVKSTQSGLQYKVLKDGDGVAPQPSDTVSVVFRGTLLDGTEFDASPEGKTTEILVAQAVPGLREALRLMSTGAHWQLVVPGTIGYGERGIGTDIGPYQTLLYDIELVRIKRPDLSLTPAKGGK